MSAAQLNDLKSYSRHWLGEFIDMYQNEACLWHPKHEEYSNHTARNKAYDKLVDKLKEVEPHPDRAMVVRKINSLRSAFRREFRKTSAKSNYETRLWYYSKLLFIAEQSSKRLTGSSLDYKPKRALNLGFDDEDSMEYDDENQIEANVTNHVTTNVSGHSSQTESIVADPVTVATDGECVALVKTEEHHQQQTTQLHHLTQSDQQHTAVKVLEITSLDSNSQREIQQAVNSLEQQHQLQQQQQQQTNGTQLTQIHQQVPTIQISREHLHPLFSNSYATTSHRQDDEYDAIGINVASKLRVMNPTQRIIAEKLISDVLFNGQLDNLSINSTLAQ